MATALPVTPASVKKDRKADMDPQVFSEWLSAQSLPARITALSRIYSQLTINARELFIHEWTAGKERRVLEILQGLNEIHHTISNQLTAYTTDEHKAYPIQSLSRMLQEIETKYQLGGFLTPAIEFARNQSASSP